LIERCLSRQNEYKETKKNNKFSNIQV